LVDRAESTPADLCTAYPGIR